MEIKTEQLNLKLSQKHKTLIPYDIKELTHDCPHLLRLEDLLNFSYNFSMICCVSEQFQISSKLHSNNDLKMLEIDM